MTLLCSKQTTYYTIWIAGTIISIFLFFFIILRILLRLLGLDLATGVSPFWEENQWVFWVVIVLLIIIASCFILFIPYLLAVKFSKRKCNAVLETGGLRLDFRRRSTIILYKNIKSITFTSVRYTKGKEPYPLYNIWVKLKRQNLYIQSPSLLWGEKLSQKSGIKFNSKIN